MSARRVVTRTREETMHKIFKVIREEGPRNYSLISKSLKMQAQTVRYKIKKQLLERGFWIQVEPDYYKLGLMRLWAFLDFHPRYEDDAPNLLELLSKRGYLTYYGLITPQGRYLVMFGIPPKVKGEYGRFMQHLVDLKFLKSYDIIELSWMRNLSMRPEFYNFAKGEWRFDWDELDKLQVKIEHPDEKISEEPQIDKIDLLILKELEIDSTQSLSKISKKLGINVKTLRYHYSYHVVKRGLIRKFILKWCESPKKLRQSVLRVILQYHDLPYEDRLRVENVVNQIPFTWFDAYSKDRNIYFAYLTLPADHLFDTLNYLQSRIPDLNRNMEYFIIDITKAEAKTIPYEMYEDGVGWRLGDFFYEVLMQVPSILKKVGGGEDMDEPS